MIIYFELAHIVAMHRVLIEKYGGLDGIRDQGLLESAISQAAQNVFGKELFSSIPAKAAAYAFYLSENQPFIDGNKRIATAAALTFLRLNAYDLKISDEGLYKIIMKLANKGFTRESFVAWFEKNAFSKKKKK